MPLLAASGIPSLSLRLPGGVLGPGAHRNLAGRAWPPNCSAGTARSKRFRTWTRLFNNAAHIDDIAKAGSIATLNRPWNGKDAVVLGARGAIFSVRAAIERLVHEALDTDGASSSKVPAEERISPAVERARHHPHWGYDPMEIGGDDPPLRPGDRRRA